MSAGDDGPWVEADEIGVRLLVYGPPAPDAGLIAQRLGPALGAGVVAAFVADEATPEDALVELQGLCREHEVAFLLRGPATRVIERGADGVHLDDPDALTPARRLLGLERLIGVGCDRSRHAAMLAGEDGADYVTFGSLGDPDRTDDLVDLVRWWSELFVLPVAAVAPASAEDARALVEAGVDFLIVGGAFFRPDGAGEARLREIVSLVSDAKKAETRR